MKNMKLIKREMYFEKMPKKCQKYDARESILSRFYFLDI